MATIRYREEVLLGTGGMAEVWRASGPFGVVALKRLLPHAARNPSLVAAFEREGRLLQRIQHPNVVGIHEVMREERGTSLVLEYVDGIDLRALEGQPAPEKIALRVARDVLRALEAVHGLADETGRSLGLIHRDLSPSNVLVRLDGAVKLADFGIARAVSGTHATTGINVKGTLAYISPEQANGAPVDARADLFAVGALLYEMLAGEPIYLEADPPVALARARAGDVKSLAIARPATPFPIVELVDRSLAASPVDRFPSAASMLAELERVAEQTSGLATDQELAEWAEGLSSMVKRSESVTPQAASATLVAERHPSRRWVALLAALAFLVAGVLWFGLTGGRAKKARSTAAPPSVVARGTSAGGESEPVLDVAPAASEVRPTTATPQQDRSTGQPSPADRSRRSSQPDRRAATADKKRSAPSIGAETSGEKCFLDIGSEPAFAYVTLDGVKVGSTPLFNREVSPGTHRIQVSREGLGSKSFTVEVHPGDRISRVVKLP